MRWDSLGTKEMRSIVLDDVVARLNFSEDEVEECERILQFHLKCCKVYHASHTPVIVLFPFVFFAGDVVFSSGSKRGYRVGSAWAGRR